MAAHDVTPAYADGAAYTLEHPERPGIVVALHGLTGTRAQPLAYLEGFDDPTWGILAPDLRAHGETGFEGEPEDFTPDQLAADVEALLSRLGLGSRRIALVGVSLGATVALAMLRRGALDVAACLMLRPAHAAEAPEHLRINARIAAWLKEDPATALDRLRSAEEYRSVAAVSERAATSLRQKVTKPRSAERAMRLERGATWTAFSADERIADAPATLIIAASNDPQHPVAVAEAWQARIAGSRLVVLPPWDDDPSAHTALMRSHVQACLSRAAPRPLTAP